MSLEFGSPLVVVLLILAAGVLYLLWSYGQVWIEVQELRRRVGEAPDLVSKLDQYHELVEGMENDLRGLIATQSRELRVELAKKVSGSTIETLNSNFYEMNLKVEDLRSQIQSIATWSKSLAPKADNVGVVVEELAGNLQTLSDQVKDSVQEIHGRVAAVEITVEQLTRLSNDVRELQGDVNANRNKLRDEIEDVASDLRYFRTVFGQVEGKIAAKFSAITEGLTKITEAVTK